MMYAHIDPCDFSNGDGINVSLWTTGCPHRCEGCHNPELLDNKLGKEFIEPDIDTIIKAMNNGIPKGLSILGGEPLSEQNYEGVLYLVQRIKKALPDRVIWLWTGYYYDELVDLEKTEILNHIDFLIDGRFEKDNPSDCKYYGSENQRIHYLNNSRGD